jgi:hypothetical protein
LSDKEAKHLCRQRHIGSGKRASMATSHPIRLPRRCVQYAAHLPRAMALGEGAKNGRLIVM